MATIFGQTWTRAELQRHVGHPEQIAGIKALEGADGTERGARLFEIWTGAGLQFEVLADRALDISMCRYQGRSLAWRSAQGDVHPAYYEASGTDWLRSFPGGLLATCGLDHFGASGTDAGEAFGIHGRVGNLPARYVNHRAYWQGDEYVLEISGEVRQSRVYGENLVLRRRLTTALGSTRIDIADSVTNEGYEPQPHMILYHFNLGFPLLSPASRLVIDAAETLPRDEVAAAGLATWQTFQPPTPAYREQVFRHQPRPDADDMVQIDVLNPDLKLGVRFRYDSATLPYVFQWKNTGEGIYVLGVEPANCGVIEGRAVARARGLLPILRPGEEQQYRLSVEAMDLP